MKFTIPASIEEATEALAGVERLLTAKRWERAAIVAAFVHPDLGNGGREEAVSSDHLESARTFARRGITGLKSHVTVSEYAQRWLAVRPRPVPGQSIDLDGLPEWESPSPGSKSKADDIRTQPGAVATAMADPEFAAKVAERMPDTVKAAVAKTTGKAIADNNSLRYEVAAEVGKTVLPDSVEQGLRATRNAAEQAQRDLNAGPLGRDNDAILSFDEAMRAVRGTDQERMILTGWRDRIDNRLLDLTGVDGAAADLTPEMFMGASE